MTDVPIEKLLRDVDAFLDKTGMAESTLGRLAVNDGKFVQRLRDGKRAWPETIDRLRNFMRANSSWRKRKAA